MEDRDLQGRPAAEGPRTGFRAWVPPMDRAERQALFERVGADAVGGRDYYVMMALAATVASLGLLQNSTAVVIGAMLIAPLMGPLLGAGLALVQGNLELMRRSLTSSVLGIGLALAIATAIGAFNPGFEPTMEVEARGRPDLFDLFVALASGIIAAYAQCRTSLSNSLAGVAIAAALLPPLAVVGISLMLGEVEIAVFAAILLTTNVVAIVLGAAVVFWLAGVQVRRETGGRPWARLALATLSLLAVILVAPLMLRGLDGYRLGQTRPATYPVSVPVREAVSQYLLQYQGVDLISMARMSVEPESGITLVLSTVASIPHGFRRGLRNAIRVARGENPLDDLIELDAHDMDDRVRIFIVTEAPSDPPPPGGSGGGTPPFEPVD